MEEIIFVKRGSLALEVPLPVVIKDETLQSIQSLRKTKTSFGNYTVDAATSAHWDNRTGTMTAGVGTGNKGANGTYSYASGSDWPNVYGTGTFSQKYGYGGGAEYASYGTDGGPGAVYLKYLGA